VAEQSKDITFLKKPRRTLRRSIQGEQVRTHRCGVRRPRRHPVAELLGVSTSGFYKHVHTLTCEQPTPRLQRRRDLEVKIIAHHKVSGGTYGSPRITADLHDEGEQVSANTVAKITTKGAPRWSQRRWIWRSSPAVGAAGTRSCIRTAAAHRARPGRRSRDARVAPFDGRDGYLGQRRH
jgi:hypothetical protein